MSDIGHTEATCLIYVTLALNFQSFNIYFLLRFLKLKLEKKQEGNVFFHSFWFFTIYSSFLLCKIFMKVFCLKNFLSESL